MGRNLFFGVFLGGCCLLGSVAMVSQKESTVREDIQTLTQLMNRHEEYRSRFSPGTPYYIYYDVYVNATRLELGNFWKWQDRWWLGKLVNNPPQYFDAVVTVGNKASQFLFIEDKKT